MKQKISVTSLNEVERLQALHLLAKCGLAVQLTKEKIGNSSKYNWWLEYAKSLEVG